MENVKWIFKVLSVVSLLLKAYDATIHILFDYDFKYWKENKNQGFFLQNGGYYFVVSDNLDLALLGDIYTNGSWGLRAESSYVKRYKYSGNFNFRYENLISSLRGFNDYSKGNNYNISWSHTQDQKASPNSRFSASVNLGSSKYFKQSNNEYNNNNFLNNIPIYFLFYIKISYTST